MKKRHCGFWLPVLLALALLTLYPLAVTVAGSFMPEEEILRRYGSALGDRTTTYMAETIVPTLLPDCLTGDHYLTLFSPDSPLLPRLANSLLYTLPTTVLQLLVTALTAYGFCRCRGCLRDALFFLYTVLMLLPTQAALVPNYLVSKTLGIFDTPWAIWLPGIFSPFGVFLLTRYMGRISRSCIEAAQLDGAGEWILFTRICLPQCKSILVTIGLLTFFDTWAMVEQPMVLLETKSKLPLSASLHALGQEEFGISFAAATIYMLPCLVLFLWGRKHLDHGLTPKIQK